ncbi:uncharacterized protein [Eurosta solidaginis]|uniref:uncharacterized protein isoform X2 n=1 Tax=Eurosta solidaginis TaxID=178769 RepID=UPI0035306F30
MTGKQQTNSTSEKSQGDGKKVQQTKNTTQLRHEELPIQYKETTSSEQSTSGETKGLSAMLATNILKPISEGAIIDTDLQNMRHDLQQSYELFQKMSEKFQAIDFSSLKSRIREINLGKKESNIKLNDEIKNALQKHYNDKTLSKLTIEMGEKFSQHPGEFGNIPELSEFFKTCSQLQHGLEQLKRQRQSMDDLTKRLSHAAETSYARINEIQNAMYAKNHNPHEKLDE